MVLSYYHDYYTVEWQTNLPKRDLMEEESLISAFTGLQSESVSASTRDLTFSRFLQNLILVLSLRHVHQAVVHISLPVAHAWYNLCQILTYFSRIMPNAIKLPILLEIMLANLSRPNVVLHVVVVYCCTETSCLMRCTVTTWCDVVMCGGGSSLG